MPFSLNLQARRAQVAEALQRAMDAPGDDLAPAALAIARVEYPHVDADPYLRTLDRMGEAVSARIGDSGPRDPLDALRALNEYLYDEQGFRGNRQRYEDPRNSFLNEVLDRRTGIPISLAIVYIEVAARAGLHVSGINFPGHFLLRVPVGADRAHVDTASDALIVDPFHGGATLSEVDCRALLRQHVGESAAFDRSLLDPATRKDIVVRTLVNLKRLYVRMRSYPQARFTSDLLLTIDPAGVSELRDRGLLAYHLQDFAAALRDLEAYLRLLPGRTVPPATPADEVHEVIEEGDDPSQGDDDRQIWEHVKTLRKRVAGLN